MARIGGRFPARNLSMTALETRRNTPP